MDPGYAIVPFVAWLIAGSLKFAINSARSGQLSFTQIGYGGLPSNHSAIVSSVAALIALREGIDHPAFGVAIALSFVVMLDANSLRRQIGRQAEVINKLAEKQKSGTPLRERMGHSKVEILAGTATGIIAAWLVNNIF